MTHPSLRAQRSSEQRMTLRALIVDDERLAREELRSLLGEHPDVIVAGDASTVADARSLVESLDPDVVFLDIELVGESGFELVADSTKERSIVFVTAHAEHAVRAFDVRAYDYLLKPVEPARLAETIAGLRSRARTSGPPDTTPLGYDDRLLLRIGGRHMLLPVNRIACITAGGDYSSVMLTDGAEWETGKSMREWEARLPDRRFARVHRSAIVNLACVARIEPWSHSSYLLYVTNRAAPLTLSRRYAALLRARLS
jgi:two-component system LytT family response regulator